MIRSNDFVYSILPKANATPISWIFFSSPIYHTKLKTLKLVICLWSQLFRTLWLVDHSNTYHVFSQSFRMKSLLLKCLSTTLKRIYPNVNIRKHRRWCALNFNVTRKSSKWKYLMTALIFLNKQKLFASTDYKNKTTWWI